MYDNIQDHTGIGSSAYLMTLPAHPRPQEFESFTSYRIRLAEANSIETVNRFAELLFPDDDLVSIKNLSNNPPYSYGSLALAANCTQENIISTTYAPISNAFGRPATIHSLKSFLDGSVTDYLRYCPYCIYIEPWYLLQWQFLKIKGCPIHSCYLVDKCMKCHAQIQPWTSPLIINTCRFCNELLYRADTSILSIEDEVSTRFYWNEITDIISWSKIGPGDRLPYFNLRTDLRIIRINRGLTVQNIANISGIQPDKILSMERDNYKHGGYKLHEYFSYLKALEMTISRLMYISYTNSEENQDYKKTTRIGQDISRDKIFSHNEETLLHSCEETIEKLMRLEINISLNSVSTIANIDRNTIKSYPSACELINKFRKPPKINRKTYKDTDEYINDISDRIRTAIYTMQKENIKYTFGSVCIISSIGKSIFKKHNALYTLTMQLLTDFRRNEIEERILLCRRSTKDIYKSSNASLLESLRRSAIKHKSLDEVEQSYRLSEDVYTVQKWAVIWLLGIGLSIQQIAYILECSNQTIINLCRNYEREGPSYIKRHRNSTDKKSLLSEDQLETLRTLLTKPAADGEAWTPRLVADWIGTQIGRNISLGSARKVLYSLSPTPFYPIPRQRRQ